MGKKKPLTPQEKQQIYETEHAALLKKLDLGMMHVIEFPHLAKVPFFSRVALQILMLQGVRAGVRFVDLTK